MARTTRPSNVKAEETFSFGHQKSDVCTFGQQKSDAFTFAQQMSDGLELGEIIEEIRIHPI